jgi:chemotaxis protein MotB
MRKKKPPEHVNHERWLVSYADFITLLFAFFTTLYAISTVDQKKMGKMMFSMRTAFNVDFFKGAPAEAKPLAGNGPAVLELPKPATGGEGDGGQERYRKLVADLARLADDPLLKGRIEVREEKRGVVVALSEAFFFQSGSADLQRGTGPLLDIVARKLKGQGFDVMVEGHTDNVPIRSTKYRSNWELSTARATSVISFFLDQVGFDASRLAAAGYGEHKPVATNDTPEGRTRNRRVDIVVVPPTSMETASESPTAGAQAVR